jgi:hypothetical protein
MIETADENFRNKSELSLLLPVVGKFIVLPTIRQKSKVPQGPE